MKFSWNNYSTTTFDEYVTPQSRLRVHSKKIGTFLESLSSKELNEINTATKSVIQSMGISFRVFSDDDHEGQDRAWPLDFIPRIIRLREWSEVERGLKTKS